jgi:hypothetical protein
MSLPISLRTRKRIVLIAFEIDLRVIEAAHLAVKVVIVATNALLDEKDGKEVEIEALKVGRKRAKSQNK